MIVFWKWITRWTLPEVWWTVRLILSDRGTGYSSELIQGFRKITNVFQILILHCFCLLLTGVKMGIKSSEIAKIMICRVKHILRVCGDWFIRLSVNSCSSYVQVNSQSNALVCPLSISYDGSSLLLSSRSVPTYLQMIFQFPITNGSISWYLQLPTLSACSVTSDRCHICKFPYGCVIVQIMFSNIKSQVWGKASPNLSISGWQLPKL